MKPAGIVLFCLIPLAAAAQPDLARVEALVVDATNAFRRHEHVDPVNRNARLDGAAREFAAYLARTGKLDHDADGRTPSQRALAHGYPFCFIAENLSYEYDTRDFQSADLARRFVDGWKASPGHRRNLLRAEVIETAVAVARGAAGGPPRYYAVQLFGLPRSAGGCRNVR